MSQEKLYSCITAVRNRSIQIFLAHHGTYILGEIEMAIGTLRRVNRLYKDNKLANSELQKLLSKQAKTREKEGLMSKKMLGLDKYEEEKAKEKAEKWSQTILMSTIIGGMGVLLGGIYAWLTL